MSSEPISYTAQTKVISSPEGNLAVHVCHIQVNGREEKHKTFQHIQIIGEKAVAVVVPQPFSKITFPIVLSTDATSNSLYHALQTDLGLMGGELDKRQNELKLLILQGNQKCCCHVCPALIRQECGRKLGLKVI